MVAWVIVDMRTMVKNTGITIKEVTGGGMRNGTFRMNDCI